MPLRLVGPCSVKGCPGRGIHAGRCEQHRQTTDQRDYGAEHKAERAAWQRRMDSGELVLCRRCRRPIPPRQPDAWDCGHPAPKAPECRRCNRATAGRDKS